MTVDWWRFFAPGCRSPSVLRPEEVSGALGLFLESREVVERLVAAYQWRLGDPEVLVVLDAGHDALSRPSRRTRRPAGLTSGLREPSARNRPSRTRRTPRQNGSAEVKDERNRRLLRAWRHASVATAPATPARARSPTQPLWSPTRPT
ncbi:hypothetical protein HEP87_00210 [Streptomyces sp. S1D4-11]